MGDGNGVPVGPEDQTSGPLIPKPETVPIIRDDKGLWPPGQSGNPKGRPKGIPNYNKQLLTAIRKYKAGETTFLHQLLETALKNPAVMIKLLDKMFADPTPAAPAAVFNNVNQNDLRSSLLSDPNVRAAACALEERLGLRLANPGGNGETR